MTPIRWIFRMAAAAILATAVVALAAGSVFAACADAAGERPMLSGTTGATVPIAGALGGNAGPFETGRLVELTLIPRAVGEGEAFLVGISGSVAPSGPTDGTGAGVPDTAQAAEEDVPDDTVSFFPPPVIGEARTFLVAPRGVGDGSSATAVAPETLRVRLIAAADGVTLDGTRIEVGGARWVD